MDLDVDSVGNIYVLENLISMAAPAAGNSNQVTGRLWRLDAQTRKAINIPLSSSGDYPYAVSIGRRNEPFVLYGDNHPFKDRENGICRVAHESFDGTEQTTLNSVRGCVAANSGAVGGGFAMDMAGNSYLLTQTRDGDTYRTKLNKFTSDDAPVDVHDFDVLAISVAPDGTVYGENPGSYLVVKPGQNTPDKLLDASDSLAFTARSPGFIYEFDGTHIYKIPVPN